MDDPLIEGERVYKRFQRGAGRTLCDVSVDLPLNGVVVKTRRTDCRKHFHRFGICEENRSVRNAQMPLSIDKKADARFNEFLQIRIDCRLNNFLRMCAMRSLQFEHTGIVRRFVGKSADELRGRDDERALAACRRPFLYPFVEERESRFDEFVRDTRCGGASLCGILRKYAKHEALRQIRLFDALSEKIIRSRFEALDVFSAGRKVDVRVEYVLFRIQNFETER